LIVVDSPVEPNQEEEIKEELIDLSVLTDERKRITSNGQRGTGNGEQAG
jgi:hypothetical protein